MTIELQRRRPYPQHALPSFAEAAHIASCDAAHNLCERQAGLFAPLARAPEHGAQQPALIC